MALRNVLPIGLRFCLPLCASACLAVAASAPGARTREIVRYDGVTVHVIVEGRGPAIVLLPSLGRDSEEFDPVAERIAAAGFRVLRPQPRGYGRSVRAAGAALKPGGVEFRVECGADLIPLPKYNVSVSTVRYVQWQEEGAWLGFLEEFPDYWTQGDSLEELEENLRDLHADLTSGEIPGVRRVVELTLG